MPEISHKQLGKRRAPALARFGGNLIGVAFFALGVYFVFGEPAFQQPSAATPAFDISEIDPSPRRTILGDPPMVTIDGYEQRCNSCHKLFKTVLDPNRTRERTQHLDFTLEHGMNDYCFNCHDVDNRERLVLHDNSTVGFTDVALLCAQCHGPVYRDWDNGVHGKTLGAWSPEVGIQHKLTCTNCHDPHSPAYPPIKPLPGPNTLRMGNPDSAVHEEIGEERNVLLRWTREAERHSRQQAEQDVSPKHSPESPEHPEKEEAP